MARHHLTTEAMRKILAEPGAYGDDGSMPFDKPKPEPYNMRWIFNDGGRAAAGLPPHCSYPDGEHPGDCVTRAISIALNWDYLSTAVILTAMIEEAMEYGWYEQGFECHTQRGICRPIYSALLEYAGFEWRGTLLEGVSSPRLVPRTGTFVCRCVRHLTTVVDGENHDLEDWTRKRIYGYWHQVRPCDPELLDKVEALSDV